MKEEKVDRRIRKTKSTLLHALTALMSKKKISDITVKELTDLADVNRSTFYLYYKDIFDMVEQIENEMLEDFNDAFDEFSKDANNYSNFLSFYTHIFEYVQDNGEMCKILLGPDGDYSFIEKFKKAIIQKKPPFGETIPKIKIHFVRPFLISGCIGVIQQWLKDDLNVPPKEMALIVSDIIQNITNNL
ncbi:TetR/AcrR family transcriptional regulator [Clostridium sp. C8-1-8]|uniref:TetR/AcrR family transcriptional regulator n=1 Tax=Clostridium sp. C8-1-8 TaxID=2698831 RepID=UPI00136C76FA|nr:TetR/AcrR family transcriptional regulator [Clostridium sp. C8-1-8]